jgi:hypothetical protein
MFLFPRVVASENPLFRNGFKTFLYPQMMVLDERFIQIPPLETLPVPRKPNEELKRVVLHLYLSGYDGKMLVDKVAEVMGRRYHPGYIRKILWTLRQEGVLGKPIGSSYWDMVMDAVKAARLHALAALDEMRMGREKKALEELERVPELLARAEQGLKTLKYTFSGVRVMRR